MRDERKTKAQLIRELEEMRELLRERETLDSDSDLHQPLFEGSPD